MSFDTIYSSSFIPQAANNGRNNKTGPFYKTLRAHFNLFIENHFHQRLDHSCRELAH